MVLGWNEIKDRSYSFVIDWKEKTREASETKKFWNDFFSVFGINRRHVATFEHSLKVLKKDKRYRKVFEHVDLFWKGKLLVEHKSYENELDMALDQAYKYCEVIRDSKEFTENDLPRYLVVSDFNQLIINDLELGIQNTMKLDQLPYRIHEFGFMIGYQTRDYLNLSEINYQVMEGVSSLYSHLIYNNYSREDLQLFMTSLILCFFADDTGIFQPTGHFHFYLTEKTKLDGTDLGMHLTKIFDVLNTQEDERGSSLDEDLDQFPYLNGAMFAKVIKVPPFDTKSRELILELNSFNWSKVSPAIFGSMFQGIMDDDDQREIGAYFTSEENIMKAIRPLFLDRLKEKYQAAENNLKSLKRLLKEIHKIKILDPACGSGNFLIIAYRELRQLEIDILFDIQTKEMMKKDHKKRQQSLDVSDISKINVSQIYGIEISEFAVHIAKMGLWIVDHKMNIKLSEKFELDYVRIPFVDSPNIVCKNALRYNWNDLIHPSQLDYIIGNPPFLGKNNQSSDQKQDMKIIFKDKIKNYNLLDYVTGWYGKTINYIDGEDIDIAFVSTNSITQGQQTSILWRYMYDKNADIIFAHRTFQWNNELPGSAAVHVVIIGFNQGGRHKRDLLFDYPNIRERPIVSDVTNINPYLIDFEDILIPSRNDPISDVPQMDFGSISLDYGNLKLNEKEKNKLLKIDKNYQQFIRPLVGASEFIRGKKRWCLWFVGAQPHELRKLKGLKERLSSIRKKRMKSSRKQTNHAAETPQLFGEIRQPDKEYILIPRTTSERREYTPIGFMSKNEIISDACLSIKSSDLYLFGIIQSKMHMVWIKTIAGRLKSDYRYSSDQVYNTFPFPEDVDKKKRDRVEKASMQILDIRNKYPNSILADLYDPLYMPKDLKEAHRSLDRTVEKCYRSQPFNTDRNRLKLLFELYKKYTADT